MLKQKRESRRLKWNTTPEALLDKRADYKFQFQDELAKKVLDRRVKDLAAIYDMTGSAVIESVLTDALLPQDEKARQYVSQVLFGETYAVQTGTRKRGKEQLQSHPYRIKDAAIDIFRENLHPTHDTLLPLVQLLMDVMPAHNVGYGSLQRDEAHRSFLLKKFDALVARVKGEKEGISKDTLKLLPEHKINRWLEEMPVFRLQLESDSPSVYPFNYVELVARIWELVKGWPETYEYLGAFLEHCQDWEDTPRDRSRFQVACAEIFVGWETPEESVETLVIEPSRLGVLPDEPQAEEGQA